MCAAAGVVLNTGNLDHAKVALAFRQLAQATVGEHLPRVAGGESVDGDRQVREDPLIRECGNAAAHLGHV